MFCMCCDAFSAWALAANGAWCNAFYVALHIIPHLQKKAAGGISFNKTCTLTKIDARTVGLICKEYVACPLRYFKFLLAFHLIWQFLFLAAFPEAEEPTKKIPFTIRIILQMLSKLMRLFQTTEWCRYKISHAEVLFRGDYGAGTSFFVSCCFLVSPPPPPPPCFSVNTSSSVFGSKCAWWLCAFTARAIVLCAIPKDVKRNTDARLLHWLTRTANSRSQQRWLRQ